jgi:xylan 1,4-beta-xylosidase
MNRSLFFAVCLGLATLLPGLAPAQLPGPAPARLTYCNPMDISYRYNFEQLNERISYRSGADPVIINHKQEYYLFVTIQGGWWHSKDLLHWDYVVPDHWPMEDMCAPAALSVRDTLFLFQSTFEQRPIFYSTDPAHGKLRFYNRWLPRLPKDIGPWDPALFHDPDTDKWFMYWGSSNVYPIFGAELDHGRRLTYAGTDNQGRTSAEAYKAMFWLDPYQHGWERFGPNHSDPIKPFTEGAWMTKHHGRYYLQYAAPGTEYNVYGNGTYVGKSPLGPWDYAPYNPIAYKPGGFATGCGHGNTFQDNWGNYWNTGTTWIGVNWGMERRIVMHPAGFDADDQLHVNTRFGDWPHYLPTGPLPNRDELFTGWMLLNYRKPVVASSTLDTLRAALVADENPRTFWVAGRNKPGETLTTDLGQPSDICAVQVDYFDYKQTIFDSDSTVYTAFKLLTSVDGKTWRTVYDAATEPKRDRACAYVTLPAPVRARYVRYEHTYTAGPYLSINAFRVFGNAPGPAPATPAGLTAHRHPDQRNADISWTAVPKAVGYNVRWGIAPDKLYQTWQVWADEKMTATNTLEIRALNVGVPYCFAIEAFNESGVSVLSGVVNDGSGLPAFQGKK